MRTIPVSERQYIDVSEFINSKPDMYIAGLNDCYDFANKALARLDIVNARVQDIIKFSDNDRFTLARALVRHHEVVYGFNSETIAQTYNVSPDRVVRVGINPHTEETMFYIRPFHELSEQN